MGRTRSVGRLIGRSVDARGPVDHDSVGLAQARPNYPAKCGNMCSLADVTVRIPTYHHCDLWEPFSMLNATITYLTLILVKWL